MDYRKWSIRALYLILIVLFLIYAYKLKQWEVTKDFLTKFIEYENGGLPKAF